MVAVVQNKSQVKGGHGASSANSLGIFRKALEVCICGALDLAESPDIGYYYTVVFDFSFFSQNWGKEILISFSPLKPYGSQLVQ